MTAPDPVPVETVNLVVEGVEHVFKKGERVEVETPTQAAQAALRDPARYGTTDGKPPRPGYEGPLSRAPAPLRPDGQHEAYWILSDAERAKGFIRPVRLSYKHVGARGPVHPTRELDAVEQRLYGDTFVKFETYPPEQGKSACGRFWTKRELERVGAGCGSVTSMGRAIAETYAREPSFYGGTMCVTCGDHFPVGERGEFVWVNERGLETAERVGT